LLPIVSVSYAYRYCNGYAARVTNLTPDNEDSASGTVKDVARIAYELSLRTLNQQEATLNDLRARTGTILAATALVASFLGGRAIEKSGVDVFTVIALLAFGLSVFDSVAVLLPRQNLIFSLRGSALIEAESSEERGMPEVYRRLAFWLEGFWDDNDNTIVELTARYRRAAYAVLVEVVMWSLQLALT
jgi:hypothetical protein